ncbi:MULTISPECIES: hypothetical protein [Sphingomonas]|uniref:hypothetical protein n=1 Tax=Sphingomonas TaxID=13687 RepID=UPI00126A07F1|nr:MULTISPECIES: hypothetical protein [Sphingomonas]
MPILSVRALALAAAALAGAVPAAALQTAPPAAASAAIAPGTAVVDANGGAVGVVSRVNGDQLVVKTDKHEVQLPASSFTPHDGKLMFALTQAQLNAQAEEALAEANAKVTIGTTVYGQAGTPAGTITAIDDQYVTIKLTGGKLVRLQRNAIAPGPQGAVLGISASELQKLADQAK